MQRILASGANGVGLATGGGGRRYIIQAGLSASGLTRVRMLEREIVEFSVSGSAFSVPPDPRAVGKKKTKFES